MYFMLVEVMFGPFLMRTIQLMKTKVDLLYIGLWEILDCIRVGIKLIGRTLRIGSSLQVNKILVCQDEILTCFDNVIRKI